MAMARPLGAGKIPEPELKHPTGCLVRIRDLTLEVKRLVFADRTLAAELSAERKRCESLCSERDRLLYQLDGTKAALVSKKRELAYFSQVTEELGRRFVTAGGDEAAWRAWRVQHEQARVARETTPAASSHHKTNGTPSPVDGLSRAHGYGASAPSSVPVAALPPSPGLFGADAEKGGDTT